MDATDSCRAATKKNLPMQLCKPYCQLHHGHQIKYENSAQFSEIACLGLVRGLFKNQPPQALRELFVTTRLLQLSGSCHLNTSQYYILPAIQGTDGDIIRGRRSKLRLHGGSCSQAAVERCVEFYPLLNIEVNSETKPEENGKRRKRKEELDKKCKEVGNGGRGEAQKEG